jgi:hypothetical protein
VIRTPRRGAACYRLDVSGKIFRVTLLWIVVVAARTAVGQEPIAVPRRPAATIDGVLGDAEWHGAAARRTADGSEVLLMHDGRFLFLGVRAAKPGFVSACVVRNDTVRVLHASAALGDVAYVPQDTTWRLASRFVWGMRAREMNDDTRQRQRQYLDSAGWLGSTMQLSPAGKELQVPLDLMLRGDERLAFGYYLANDGPVIPFPQTLSDGCRDQRVVSGFLPETVRFSSRDWARLAIQP